MRGASRYAYPDPGVRRGRLRLGSGQSLTTSGILSIPRSRKTVVTRPDTFIAQGFTCVKGGPVARTGNSTGTVRCTGGTLKRGQATSLGIMVRASSGGRGMVEAKVLTRGSTAPDTLTNYASVSVAVTR